jgi:hypothetical protein
MLVQQNVPHTDIGTPGYIAPELVPLLLLLLLLPFNLYQWL